MITAQHGKELICRAYITAIAAAARQNLWVHGEFDYGVDGSFKLVETRGKRLRETGFAIDFQAKASCDWKLEGTDIQYDLEAKAYNDLTERASKTRTTPFYLLLFCLPKDEATWVSATLDHLKVCHCTYFLKLSGPKTSNKNTVRVSIPQANLFTPTNLTAILTGVRDNQITP